MSDISVVNSVASDSIDQLILDSARMHQIINGTAQQSVTVEDGSEVPTIRKAMVENFYYKTPALPWVVGSQTQVFNQLYSFTQPITNAITFWYAPGATVTNPITMGSSPFTDANWRVLADSSTLSVIYAPKNSPVLTGVPQAPTAVDTDSSDLIATTKFVKTVIEKEKENLVVGNLEVTGTTTVKDITGDDAQFKNLTVTSKTIVQDLEVLGNVIGIQTSVDGIDINPKDVDVSGDLTVNGEFTLVGGTITLGDGRVVDLSSITGPATLDVSIDLDLEKINTNFVWDENTSNTPLPSSSGKGFVIAKDGLENTQIAFVDGQANFWARSQVSGLWSDWKSSLADDEVSALGEEGQVSATPRGVGVFVGKFGISATNLESVADIDLVVKGGFFNFNASAVNAPEQISNGKGFFIPGETEGSGTQFVIGDNTANQFMRTLEAGVWSEWVQSVGPEGPQGEMGTGLNFLGTLEEESQLPDPADVNVGDTYVIQGHFWTKIESTWQDLGNFKGPKGDKGADGIGLVIKGSFTSVDDLPTTGQVSGDAYIIQQQMFVWDGTQWSVVGQVGPQGIQGPVGPQGIQGPVGPVGPVGPEGPQGIQGVKGEKGDKGDNATALNYKGSVDEESELPLEGNLPSDAYSVGTDIWAWTGTNWENLGNIQGPAGPTGAAGAQGPQGIQGPVGPIGPAGPQGEQGPEGPQGQIGPVGPQGEIGPEGQKGDQGDPGPALNPMGELDLISELPVSANKGDLWFVGEDNSFHVYDGSAFQTYGPVIGPVGPSGPAGPEGPQGDQGVPGIPANPKGLIPSENDLPSTALVGDFYVTQDTGTGFIWDGTTWVNLGVLRGPEGPQGVQGPEGIQGPVGPTGPQGPDGEIGPQGETGPMGPAGEQGPQGIQGPIGPTGPQGDIGPQGIPGTDGEDGADGPVGPEGPQGEDGPQGPQGEMGPGVKILGKLNSTSELPTTGTLGEGYLISGNFWGWTGSSYEDLGPIQGPQGEVGATGPRGAIGATGAKGEKGDKGEQGSLWIVLGRPPGAADGRVGDYFVNSATLQYYQKTSTIAWSSLGYLGGGNVYDAPSDGVYYVRKDGAWEPLVIPTPEVLEAPEDGLYYSRRNGAWASFTPLPEAPVNSNLYARSNAGWVQFVSGIPEAPINSTTAYGRANAAWLAVTPEAPINPGHYFIRTASSWRRIDRLDFSGVNSTGSMDTSTSQDFTVDMTASGERVLNITNLPSGRSMVIIITFLGSNSTMSWVNTIKWTNNQAPTLSSTQTTVILHWNQGVLNGFTPGGY